MRKKPSVNLAKDLRCLFDQKMNEVNFYIN